MFGDLYFRLGWAEVLNALVLLKYSGPVESTKYPDTINWSSGV